MSGDQDRVFNVHNEKTFVDLPKEKPERDIHDDKTIVEFPFPAGLPDDPSVSFKPSTKEKGTPFHQAGLLDETKSRLRLMRLEANWAGAVPDVPSAEAPAFLLNRVIGSGGFGDVWEAVQVSLERRVAVKRLRSALYTQKSAFEMKLHEMHFQQEALITGQLDHPNIVPVYDLGLDEEGHPLLAMKYIDGIPWSDKIYEDRALSTAERLNKHLPILLSVSQAVAFAHARGVIHRDIKPSQVMIGKFGQVYLMDWGLAASFGSGMALGEKYSFATPLKDAPNPAGTVAFMAPEQTENTTENLGAWTDVFLLGGLLYLLLTMTPPHRQDVSADAWENAVRGDVEPPEKRSPEQDIPSMLSRLCQQAMALVPKNRITALEFIRAVENYLTGKSRHEESQNLVKEADKLLQDAGGSYEELSRCEMILRRALILWPDNAEAEQLEQRLVHDFIDTALARGDLGLARFQSARVADGAERTEFLRRIVTLEKRQASRERQRKLAVGVLILLAVAVPTGWSLHLMSKLEKESVERPVMPSIFQPMKVPTPKPIQL